MIQHVLHVAHILLSSSYLKKAVSTVNEDSLSVVWNYASSLLELLLNTIRRQVVEGRFFKSLTSAKILSLLTAEVWQQEQLSTLVHSHQRCGLWSKTQYTCFYSQGILVHSLLTPWLLLVTVALLIENLARIRFHRNLFLLCVVRDLPSMTSTTVPTFGSHFQLS